MNMLRLFRRLYLGAAGLLEMSVAARPVNGLYAQGDADLIPDPADWLNISYALSSGLPASNVVQITGITERILLSISWPGSSGTVYYKVSTSSFSAGDYVVSGGIGWTSILTGGSLYVEPNQYVGFTRDQNKVSSVVMTVINRSNGGAVLDTFTSSIT